LTEARYRTRLAHLTGEEKDCHVRHG
jgi:hypothetical protein